MAAQTQPLTLAPVDDTEDLAARGRAIARKRERLGIGKSALAERANLDRATLDRVEDGLKVRSSSVVALERALADWDEEMSPPPSQDDDDRTRWSEVTLRGVYGIDEVIYKSPTTDPDEVAEAVGKIIDRLRPRQ